MLKSDLTNEKNVVQLFTDHFNTKIEFHIDDDDIESSYYEVNQSFYIYPGEGTDVRKTIGGTITRKVIEWHVYGIVRIPATHWEPEDFDEEEISVENSLTNAIKKILLLELENKIDNTIIILEEGEFNV